MEPLLEIKNLTIQGHWEGATSSLLENINLTLEKGEVLGIIGESGAGKSTLGLAAMGYTRTGCGISEGSIIFDGKELVGAPKSDLIQLRGSKIAYVAQSAAASFNPAHNLINQFAETPVRHGYMSFDQAREKAEKLYQRLNLPYPDTIGYRYPHQVSGGQLQRAMIAMALGCDPDIVVFDEPTTALDVTTQIEVLAAIRDAINFNNSAALYITHDLAVVSQVADRIMVLRYGKVVEVGETRELLNNPRQDYTRDLLNVRRQRRTDRKPLKEVVLEVNSVTAGYTENQNIIENVSFKVFRGQTVAVVGESGSGKTTVARVITGLLPPKNGTISFDGKPVSPDVRGRPTDLLRRLQMIYQMPDVALNPRQKIRRIIGRPLEFYQGLSGNRKKKKVYKLLDMIEMEEEYYNRYPSELSGGQKQRICIARALAAEPDLIICDEITSALDQLVAEEILNLLHRLQKELGISYLFITHDLATVRAIADEVIVMHMGKIVEQGKKTDIFSDPDHKYTEKLLSSVPEMDPDWLDNLLLRREQIAE